MIIQEALAHYGTPRHSGRYPWGSGGDASARNRSFLGVYEELKNGGLSEVEIAKAMGFAVYNSDGSPRSSGTTQLRNRKTIAIQEQRAARIAQAKKLKDTGMGDSAIAREMGLKNESSVRALLKPGQEDKNAILTATADHLRKQVDKFKIVDVGAGAEHYLNISHTKLQAAVDLLEEEGYLKSGFKIPQLGTPFETKYKVLAAKGYDHKMVWRDRFKTVLPSGYSDDGGRTYTNEIKYPTSIDSKRVQVIWKEDGGENADGMIYVRRGVDDVSLGRSNYAQVRIAVDGTHYLKGMAMYKDDMPKGVDLQFNTNKSKYDPKINGDKLKAMKPLERDKTTGKIDKDRPFGAIPTRQHGVMNVLNDEGAWGDWSSNFSSQFLSKQNPTFAKQQLEINYERKRSEYEEIMSLTNPVVRRKLLETFADGADSSAVNLEAAGLPRTSTHIILPSSHIKETEIYAPNYRQGERVALVRHPHGGIFEIPNLVVNNNNPKAKKMFGNMRDAVGIHPKTAAKLSGADFDGDTVLVIPNNKGKVKHEPALEALKDFDAKASYPEYPGMHIMTDHEKQSEMGKVSNLITDMTIKGASHAELARAIRHSMVVIDAQKHKLNYKLSEEDHNIKQLKRKWQDPPYYGASTIVSRAGSSKRIPERKQLVKINPKTGEQIFTPTGKTYVKKVVDKKTGAIIEKVVPKTQEVDLLSVTKDARKLVSKNPHPVELIYADHSNKLKALANQARKDAYFTKTNPYNASANKAYAKEVASLQAALKKAQMMAPIERQAQLVGNAFYKARLDANPDMPKDTRKKVKNQALRIGRERTGAKKGLIKLTQEEWNAIQAGAISSTMLRSILDTADMDVVKQLATPRQKLLMTSSKTARAKTMLANGHTQAEVANALGVSLTTLKTTLKKEGL